jgi:signal transduction histidine kinase
MSRTDPDDATLGQMLRILAHDLRNPLAVIISNLGYLQTTLRATSGDIDETIADTLSSCEDLNHIIENVDLLGQQTKGMDDGSGGAFEVQGPTAHVMKRFGALADSHSVALVSDLERVSPLLRVCGDRGGYERAFANVLRNAIQYAPAGSAVHVGLDLEPEHCRVTVSDTGASFPARWRQAAFSAEGQVNGKAKGEGRYGRGLGLYIARCAADAIGADLRVSPPPAGFRHAVALTLSRTADQG